MTADKLQDSHAPWEWPGPWGLTRLPEFLRHSSKPTNKQQVRVTRQILTYLQDAVFSFIYRYYIVMFCGPILVNDVICKQCLIDPFPSTCNKKTSSHPYVGSSAIFGFKLIRRFCFLAFRPVSLTRLRMDLPRPKQLPVHDSTTATKTESQPDSMGLSFVVRHLKKAGGPVLDALCRGARSISAVWLSG